MEMNWFEKMIASISPAWAIDRYRHRQILAAYEATAPSRLRKLKTETRGPDSVMAQCGVGLRGQARYYDENHDLVTGILDILVARTVGANGILVEPMVKDINGNLHTEFNKELSEGFSEWYERPEVTGELSGALCEQLAARTLFRDGEQFTQLVYGDKPGLKHESQTKLLLELIEPDLFPLEYDDAAKNIFQSIQKNAWGRPTTYWAYKNHPGEDVGFYTLNQDLKAIPAENILHPKFTKRIRQTRGVSILHAVLTRIEDLKDYEESERVAARVSAAMAAYIKKGTPDQYIAPDSAKNGYEDRSFKMQPGLVFDRLQVGEEVGTIQSNRPSALLEPFRNAMIKMVGKGTRVTYSSAANDYDGSYSSQRQELVEGWDQYNTLQSMFISYWRMPVHKAYIRASLLSGRHRLPRDIDKSTLLRAHYQGPAMPWIDPDKESKANERNCQAGFTSRSQVIRSRNQNPVQVRDQIKRERQEDEEDQLYFSSNIENTKTQPTNLIEGDNQDEEEQQSEDKNDA